jgi:large subunit ribosomal protein L24
MMKRHTRKNQNQQQGAIIEREGSIHRSNVMLAATYDKRADADAATEPAEASQT